MKPEDLAELGGFDMTDDRTQHTHANDTTGQPADVTDGLQALAQRKDRNEDTLGSRVRLQAATEVAMAPPAEARDSRGCTAGARVSKRAPSEPSSGAPRSRPPLVSRSYGF